MKRFGIAMVMAGALLNGAGHAATRARFAAENVLRDAGGRLSAGESHTCQVNDDGTVRCWGANHQGQLGDGTTQDRHAPVTISGLTNVVAVTAGTDHTCALLADGTARCWGDHSFGQLGNRAGPGGRSLTPVLVTFLSQAVAIIAGDSHTCTLTRLGHGEQRALVGQESSRQLGDLTTSDRNGPVEVFACGLLPPYLPV